MYTLFIDTHQKTNLAIFKDYKVINSKSSRELKQSTIIMPLLNNLLDECNLELNNICEIIVVNGPGSFTGVRLGVTIAKTIAYLKQIPIKTINSLKIKAIMDGFNNQYYGVKDAKGIYLGTLKNEDINIEYINNSEIKQENIIIDIDYDYEKLSEYISKLISHNPHQVNPLYIKKIEAQK